MIKAGKRQKEKYLLITLVYLLMPGYIGKGKVGCFGFTTVCHTL